MDSLRLPSHPISISAYCTQCLLALAISMVASFLLVLSAAEWHVQVEGGDDTADGTAEAPFASLAQASVVAQPGDTVWVGPGIYRETLQPSRSGTNDQPIRFVGTGPGVVISAFEVLRPDEDGHGNWIDMGDGRWAIDVHASHGIGGDGVGRAQVRVDGEWLSMARWPDAPAGIGFCVDREHMAVADGGGREADSDHSLDGYGVTHHRGWYLLASLPAGEWAGARIDLAPGDGWWHRTGTINSLGNGRVDFSWPGIDGAWTHREIPGLGDWFFLWGRLAALSRVGEFFHDIEGLDGPAHRLYVQLAPGQNPNHLLVELRQHEVGVQLQDRSYIVVEDMQLLGCGVAMNTSSQGNTLRRLSIDHGGQELDLRRQMRWGILLRGHDHLVENCTLLHVAGRGIDMRDSRNTARNNVVGFTRDHGIGTDGAREAVVQDNTVFDSGNTVISISAPASRFVRNRAYRAGLRIIDIAVMNTWNSGDMEDTEIAWNWVYDGLAPLDHSMPGRQWNGSQGIRLDGGGAPRGCSNAIIHHNVVWNTSSPSAIAVWAMAEGQERVGDSRVRVYHNSCFGRITVNHNGSVVGHDIRGNIAWNLNWNTDGLKSDAIIRANLFTRRSDDPPEGNYLGQPGWLSPWRRDPRLRSDSPAIAAGEAIAGGWVSGDDPDLGAYPYDSPRWEPGAVISERHIADLRARYERTWDGVARIVISGLPTGRIIPQSAVLRIGENQLEDDLHHRFTTATHLAEAVFTLSEDSLHGSHSVALALDGDHFISLTEAVVLTPPRLLGFDRSAISENDADDDGALGIIGSGLDWLPRAHLRAIDLPDTASEDLLTGPVPLRFDGASMIADGDMAADDSDLRVLVDGDGGEPLILDHYLQSGLEHSSTLVWIAWPASQELSWHGLSGERPLWLATGDHAMPGGDAGLSLLSDRWPVLADSDLLVWLHGNDLLPGSAVEQWPNRGGYGQSPAQAEVEQRPHAASDDDLGTVASFDGINDHLVLEGMGSGPGHLFVVYRNPDPGEVKWQRLLSSRLDTSVSDYQGAGHYMQVASDGEGNAIPQDAWITRRINNPNADASWENFTIGRYSLNTPSAYRGFMAEVLAFRRVLSEADRQHTNAYLARLTGSSLQLSGTALPPLQVHINGQEAAIELVGDDIIRIRRPHNLGLGDVEVEVSGGDMPATRVPGSLRVVHLLRRLGLWAADELGDLPAHMRIEQMERYSDGPLDPAVFEALDPGRSHEVEIQVLGDSG